MRMRSEKQISLADHQFLVNNKVLEIVDNYVYLGVNITHDGKLNSAEDYMTQKAQRALFKLKSLLYSTKVKPKLCLKLFDQLIKPICLYGSELWRMNAIKGNFNLRKLFQSPNAVKCEKVQLSFCRFILGLHKKSSNLAVMGELGKYPLSIDILGNLVLYNNYVRGSKASKLLKTAFSENS